MILVAVAASSLLFAGCGGKKDEMTMGDHAGKNGSEATMDSNAKESMDKAAVVEKPTLNSVHFDFDSVKINTEGQNILSAYATWLNANTDINVTVEGNCDERGSREYNLALGDRRANSVRDVLVANGVSIDRIETVSFGEERAICTGTGEACWAQNRHGDIVNR